ncbi:hypothetical protein B0H14DRAFT_3633076 [Mycena olivaceomarginata]|nr:hypothetical protein B0H14DRAFT_3633076 [Mycena olivaceomarginata]
MIHSLPPFSADRRRPVSAPGHKAGKTALTPPPPVVPRSSAYIWLALPHNVTAGPNEAVVRAPPHRETWHQVRHRYKQRWLGYPEEDEVEEPDYAKRETPGMRVQVVRSVSDWSHGVLTEHSIQNACKALPPATYPPSLPLIEEAEHFIYIENQFFISSTYDNDEVKNQIAGALVIVTIPGFSGNILDEGSLKIIMAAQYRTINRGGHSIYAEIRKAGFEPLDFIRFYHLRSYDRINAPLCKSPLLSSVRVKHHEAQIALARQWIGNDSDGSPKEVTISLPVETKDGIVHTDKTPLKTETVPIPESEDAARGVIEKFEAVAKAVRGDEDVADNVAQHMLHDRTSLLEEKWRWSEQEELDTYVSELLYIHTKLMIVDDKRMGSANINDRSQKVCDGDSEIALVVEDGDMIRSTMNGKPYEVARFATTSSSAHLGLIPPQTSHKRTEEATSFMRPAPTLNEDEAGCEEDGLVADPLPEQMVELWNKTARKNREIFTEIFRPVPTNLVRDWEAYDPAPRSQVARHTWTNLDLGRPCLGLLEVCRGSLVFYLDSNVLYATCN